MESPATALGFSISVNNAIGYLGSKPGYEREWPDRDPASAEEWEKARLLLLVVEEETQNDRSQRGEGQIKLTKDQRQRFDELVDALRAAYLHHRCRSAHRHCECIGHLPRSGRYLDKLSSAQVAVAASKTSRRLFSNRLYFFPGRIMLVASGRELFEGGFPMRMVLLVVAVAVAFVLWDRFQNEGRYTAQVEASFRQAAADLPSGSYGREIRLNRDLMKH